MEVGIYSMAERCSNNLWEQDQRRNKQRVQEVEIMNNIRDISFQNGNHAKLVTTTADASAAAILTSLEIKQTKNLILILGGATGLDESLKPRLFALFSRSIARAAIETGAVIMDGETTFSDMKPERSALHRRVFPRLR